METSGTGTLGERGIFKKNDTETFTCMYVLSISICLYLCLYIYKYIHMLRGFYIHVYRVTYMHLLYFIDNNKVNDRCKNLFFNFLLIFILTRVLFFMLRFHVIIYKTYELLETSVFSVLKILRSPLTLLSNSTRFKF